MHTKRQIIGAPLVAVVVVIAAASMRADETRNASPEKEQAQLAVLRSDASPAEKAIACKLLAIHGSKASVPDLAALLADAELASWARIALEVIPGKEADDALRNATDALDGKLLVGAINSIGVRRDAAAVELLAARLKDDDDEVASAAAVALGHIGNNPAAEALRKSLAASSAKVRSAVAEGCVLCAERFLSAGNSAVAAEIYDEVRNAEVPQQRILEALRGAILARNEAGIPLLVEQFRSADKTRFQMALSIAREFPGGKVDQALVDEMVRATPQRAALIVQAMADRPETVILPAVLQAAAGGPKPVRLAAIGALARVGNLSCLAKLLEVAVESDAELVQAAKATLADIPGKEVDAQIVALLPDARGKTYPLLIELVGTRRIAAVPTLLKALDHADPAVRSAALTALGETVSLENLNALTSRVTAPKHPQDTPVAERALRAASIRMPDREACAAQLADAIEQTASVSTKTILLEILGEMGGTNALATVGAAAKSGDPRLQDVSSQLLGKWMTADAAPVLLDVAKTATADKYHVRAIRGYIRIVRQFNLAEQQRAEMCQNAFEAARRSGERNLVLEVLERYPNRETLKLAIAALKDPEVKERAYQATLTIAQKLDDKGDEVRELLVRGGIDKVKVEIVKAEYGAGNNRKDVTEVLQKQARDFPLILLGKRSYNASFGGDPAPGVTKELKVEYRINGKAGAATFPENAVIVLPVPE